MTVGIMHQIDFIKESSVETHIRRMGFISHLAFRVLPYQQELLASANILNKKKIFLGG